MAVLGVNAIPLRSLMPRASGLSLSNEGSSASPPTSVTSPQAQRMAASSEAAQAAQVGAQGSPIIALVVMAILLFGLMFVAKRFGSEGSTFSSIKLSVYNILVISLAAIIGINFFKLVFTKFKVPGVSTMVLAA
jgi:hypothetical protein